MTLLGFIAFHKNLGNSQQFGSRVTINTSYSDYSSKFLRQETSFKSYLQRKYNINCTKMQDNIRDMFIQANLYILGHNESNLMGF